MRGAVKQDRVKSRVAEYDFQNAPRRRIAPEYRVNLLADGSKHQSQQYYAGVVRPTLAILPLTVVLLLGGCSSPAPQTKPGTIEITGPATTISKHPLAKYVELAGFRLSEKKPGQLEVKLVAINHSEADLGDLDFTIRLRTTTAKPEDPPVAEFQAKVPALGPLENKDVTGIVNTTMRIYELPDWQFLRSEFDITSPAP